MCVRPVNHVLLLFCRYFILHMYLLTYKKVKMAVLSAHSYLLRSLAAN